MTSLDYKSTTPCHTGCVSDTEQAADARRHIVIVGGGTAGWMSAATLRRRLACRVTVVESARLPPIGVGEATIPAMVDWIENMGIDEDEFVRRTGATYKLAIRFDDWVEPKHRYWHPFGICGCPIDGADLIHAWRQGVREGWLPIDSQYTDYSFQRELGERGCGPRSPGQPSVAQNYAFHLDAGKLATFLKEVALAEGVEHLVGDVSGAELDEQGEIASLQIENWSPLRADLFVDCSGFSSVLIDRVMGSVWTDWSDQLICDSAVTLRLPRDQDDASELPAYTISTGMTSGWSWQIPLQGNVGCGYVYSSKHIGDDEARGELIRLIGGDLASAETRLVPMRIGMRSTSWIGNCVALGLSAGFVEPLESTGIFLVQRALDELVECLPDPVSPTFHSGYFDSETFNARMTDVTTQVRDFVLMHYVVSRRRDTPFWRDAGNVALPDSLTMLLEEYTATGRVRLPERDPTFAEANHHFILSPAGIHPGSNNRVVESHPETVQRLLAEVQHQHTKIALGLPSHADLIHSIHSSAGAAGISTRLPLGA